MKPKTLDDLTQEVFGGVHKAAAQEFLSFFDKSLSKHHPGADLDDDEYPNEDGEE